MQKTWTVYQRHASKLNHFHTTRLRNILELRNGKRSQGDQKKRVKDTLKAGLKAFSICHTDWECLAQDRAGCRSIVGRGASLCELYRTTAAEEHRAARKARDPNSSPGAILCHSYGRLFQARMDLTSHLRTRDDVCWSG